MPEEIDCQEAQRLANLYFNDLGGDVVRGPYLRHAQSCESCQSIHERRMDDLEELGKLMADAFGSDALSPEEINAREP